MVASRANSGASPWLATVCTTALAVSGRSASSGGRCCASGQALIVVVVVVGTSPAVRANGAAGVANASALSVITNAGGVD